MINPKKYGLIGKTRLIQTYTGLAPFGGFEAIDGWGGALPDTDYFYSGTQSRRLTSSPSSGLSTYKSYPLVPPLDLSIAQRFTIQTMMRNRDPGFWSSNLNLVLTDGDTFLNKTLSFGTAFHYNDNLNVWVKRTVEVDWYGFNPKNIVQVIWNLNSYTNFGGGLAYIDYWNMELDKRGALIFSGRVD